MNFTLGFSVVSLLVVIYFLYRRIINLNKKINYSEYNLEQIKKLNEFLKTQSAQQDIIHEKYSVKITEHNDGKLSFIELPTKEHNLQTRISRPIKVQEPFKQKN